MFDVITLPIAAVINEIDLFSNLGISLFSSEKNGFKPFWILLFVKYIRPNIHIKDTIIVIDLYLIWSVNAPI